MSNTNASLHQALVELTKNEINQVAGGANCFWGVKNIQRAEQSQ
jgi:hypothetical protein